MVLELLFASAPAGWHQDGHGTMAAAMVDLCVCWLFLLVCCAMFYVDDIAIVTENRLISMSNDKIV
jgi:hypothetical protein